MYQKQNQKGNMESTNELSPQAQRALRKIRALRSLPETTGTQAAEYRLVKSLNVSDTLALAIALYEDEAEGAR
jgi:hypothetical protein